jgi:hypothetical protein
MMAAKPTPAAAATPVDTIHALLIAHVEACRLADAANEDCALNMVEVAPDEE